MPVRFIVAWLQENYPETRGEVIRQWITAEDALDVHEETICSYGANDTYLILISSDLHPLPITHGPRPMPALRRDGEFVTDPVPHWTARLFRSSGEYLGAFHLYGLPSYRVPTYIERKGDDATSRWAGGIAGYTHRLQFRWRDDREWIRNYRLLSAGQQGT
ncbi:hypothetical protein CVT26_010398 [Gymnopilus dilepis]|uniref:Uncharacterized protein n=1 Tax=Gymnopilus dilepis TaxID=231916 RepID=A0A409VZ54_9AGAR|nr:hypothetical protein CVT26_010398 [Gymnopilus dilepis]